MNVILISDSPPVGRGWFCIFLLPLAPVGFRENGFHLLFQRCQIILNDIPHILCIHSIIAVNNVVAHIRNDFPLYLMEL